MIHEAVILALMITGIHVCFQEGMVFGWYRIMVANLLDWMVGMRVSTYIQKPLWGCMPCMSGIWTIILTLSFTVHTLCLALIVCGILAIIDVTFFSGIEISRYDD